MTNPTLEQRAREIAIAAHDAEHGPGITLTNPAPWIVNAILEAFSHTGVEQAIEACAKVEWRPIETAPKDGTSVLVAYASTAENSTYGEDGYRCVFQASYEDDMWLSQDCARLESEKWRVTHWMPLPDIPDTNPLPAQSPDDIAYAGAVQGEDEPSETLEEYSERIVAKTRKLMLDRLPDDVIGDISKSHLVFGKACAQVAVSTAMEEMAEKLAEEKAKAPAPSPVNVEGLVEAIRSAAETFDGFAASLREQGADRFAQEIAVAELSAADVRQALASLSRNNAPLVAGADGMADVSLEDHYGAALARIIDFSDVDCPAIDRVATMRSLARQALSALPAVGEG